MQSITGCKSDKTLFLICNLVLLVVWLKLVLHLVTRWSVTPSGFRSEVALFVMFFSFWWSTLIFEKRGVVSLLMAGGVFMTVAEIVRTFM